MRLFDLHCDTLYECLTKNKSFWDNDLQISLNKGTHLSNWVQCFAIWIPDDKRGEDAWNLFNHAYKKFTDEIAKNHMNAVICRSYKDICEALNEQKCACIFTVEGSAAIGGKLENIKLMSELGVRVMTTTWNKTCEFGDGVLEENAKGITPFGKGALALMEKHNIIADVSHASDRLFYDIASLGKRPFIATHSNSRRICNNKRNLTDEQFLQIKTVGGLVGLNFYKLFVDSAKDSGLSSIMRHLEHFLSLGGENIISIGSDFDGCDTIGEISDIRSIDNLLNYLLIHNYSEELLDKLFFKNSYDFWERYET